MTSATPYDQKVRETSIGRVVQECRELHSRGLCCWFVWESYPHSRTYDFVFIVQIFQFLCVTTLSQKYVVWECIQIDTRCGNILGEKPLRTEGKRPLLCTVVLCSSLLSNQEDVAAD